MTDTAMQVAAILVAAGRGTRAGAGPAKQYRLVDGEPVLAKALAPFLAEPAVDLIQVVIGAEDEVSYTRAIGDQGFGKLASPVIGGATRQDSVLNGLRALRARGFDGIVLVHDAARAFVSRDLIGTAISAVREQIAAIPALAVTDTIKRVDSDGRVVETPPRAALVSVQTPQAFHFQPLLAAHEAAAADGVAGLTDDAGLMEWAGHPVATFPGEMTNLKLTHPQDFEREQQAQLPLVVRVGSGYDVHAFTKGDHVWLGGVRIPHDRGVLAHSDGDVALHALTDALLGALADGDIGTHFPPSDPQWKDAASVHFLNFAAERVRQRGGRIDFVDLTIISEAPKVGPYREAIRAVIGRATAISPDKVAIKATTSERLGFVGRREGLEAFATVTIRLPEQE